MSKTSVRRLVKQDAQEVILRTWTDEERRQAERAMGLAEAAAEDGHGALNAEVGKTVCVYFVNGSPNLTSAWHPIDNVWSRLYRDDDLVSEPTQYVETTPVAPGTATIGEMELLVPGLIKIVDHALSRVTRRGAITVIEVTGEDDSEIYSAEEEES